jgi:hypothetical protein
MSDVELEYCKVCGRRTLHLKPSTSHLLHLIMSIITMGFWLPVWLILSIRHEFESECVECGGVDNVIENTWDEGRRPVKKDSYPYRVGKALISLKSKCVGLYQSAKKYASERILSAPERNNVR